MHCSHDDNTSFPLPFPPVPSPFLPFLPSVTSHFLLLLPFPLLPVIPPIPFPVLNSLLLLSLLFPVFIPVPFLPLNLKNVMCGHPASSAATGCRCLRYPVISIIIITGAVQPVATCRQSPYRHKPATVKLLLLIHGFKFRSAFLY